MRFRRQGGVRAPPRSGDDELPSCHSAREERLECALVIEPSQASRLMPGPVRGAREPTRKGPPRRAPENSPRIDHASAPLYFRPAPHGPAAQHAVFRLDPRGDGAASRAGAPARDSPGRVRRTDDGRRGRPAAEAPFGAAQLSDPRASALHPRRNPPGDAAIFLRERDRRRALQPRPPGGGLSARQDAARQAAVRHAIVSLFRRVRMDAAFAQPASAGEGAIPHPGRRPGLRAALFGFGAEHFGHELRRAQRQRHPRAEWRRENGRLRA